MPLPLMIMPLFRSICIFCVCAHVCVCVFDMRGNSREYFVYRINIDTNQARVQLICVSVTGAALLYMLCLTAHWRWILLSKLGP